MDTTTIVNDIARLANMTVRFSNIAPPSTLHLFKPSQIRISGRRE